MTPETPCTPTQRVLRWLRSKAMLLFVAAFYPLYRLARALSEAGAGTDAPPADAASAAAQVSAQWLNLAGPGSKLLIAAFAFAAAVAFVWGTMHMVTPVLAHWARGRYAKDATNPATDFKDTFLHLPYDQQIKLFCAVWLGLLGLFAVCWLGAALVQ